MIFLFRNFNKSESMILNAEEITSVYHFPNPYLETKKVKSLESALGAFAGDIRWKGW